MAEHGVEGYNNSGVSTQLIGDFIEVPHEKPWRYQEGDLTVTRGSAWSGPGCHDGCGVLLYTDKDGKLVKVEGDPENPYNKGRLCVRCLDVPEVTYNKDRLLYPMKRDPRTAARTSGSAPLGTRQWTRFARRSVTSRTPTAPSPSFASVVPAVRLASTTTR